jgi:hypothetical protein
LEGLLSHPVGEWSIGISAFADDDGFDGFGHQEWGGEERGAWSVVWNSSVLCISVAIVSHSIVNCRCRCVEWGARRMSCRRTRISFGASRRTLPLDLQASRYGEKSSVATGETVV